MFALIQLFIKHRFFIYREKEIEFSEGQRIPSKLSIFQVTDIALQIKRSLWESLSLTTVQKKTNLHKKLYF